MSMYIGIERQVRILFPSVLCLVFALTTYSVATGAHTTREKNPDLNGLWANALLTPEDERWRIEDIACARTGCSLAGFIYLQSLLNDEKNAERSVKELFFDMRDYEKEFNKDMLTPLGLKKQAEYKPSDGAALDCKPDGDSLRHQITAPVPMHIEQLEDRIIIRYEYWNAVRTVYLDGRSYPEGTPATRLGHSLGRYEGQTLIIETTNVIPNVTGVPGGGAFAPSADTKFVERYTLNPEDNRLDLELTIVDPVHFRKPYGNQRSYLPAPSDWELDEFVCEAITGEY
ncbi:MAG: hypothetical protein GKR93_00610 [Gammaproteobacteria bacterium]|nr:hypothetical protein [Gammaproteobacteria bacterium]